MLREVYPNRWFVWCVVFLLGIGTLLLLQITLVSKEIERLVIETHTTLPLSKKPIRINPIQVDTATTTYVNTEYGFSFSYPGDWLPVPMKERVYDPYPVHPSPVFEVEFFDPDAIGYEYRHICTSHLEKATPLPSHLTTEQCETIVFDMVRPYNIFIRVYNASLDKRNVREWLTESYKSLFPKGEHIQAIGTSTPTLGGTQALVSAIGCCMGIDTSYVVKHGDYIFEFGSNGTSAEDIIKQMKSGFSFLSEGEKVSTTTPPWNPYNLFTTSALEYPLRAEIVQDGNIESGPYAGFMRFNAYYHYGELGYDLETYVLASPDFRSFVIDPMPLGTKNPYHERFDLLKIAGEDKLPHNLRDLDSTTSQEVIHVNSKY